MSLAVLSPAAAAPNQRDVAVRFGLTPEQSAGLYSQVDGMRGQMATLARSNGIKDATLRAIALELGARSPNLSKEQFVSLIEARAGGDGPSRDWPIISCPANTIRRISPSA